MEWHALKVFFYYFCLIIEGSRAGPRTTWSGSRRPKNIRIRLRIRNTALKYFAKRIHMCVLWLNQVCISLGSRLNLVAYRLSTYGTDLLKVPKSEIFNRSDFRDFVWRDISKLLQKIVSISLLTQRGLNKIQIHSGAVSEDLKSTTVEKEDREG